MRKNGKTRFDMSYPILDHPDYFVLYRGRQYWFRFYDWRTKKLDFTVFQMGRGGRIAIFRVRGKLKY